MVAVLARLFASPEKDAVIVCWPGARVLVWKVASPDTLGTELLRAVAPSENVIAPVTGIDAPDNFAVKVIFCEKVEGFGLDWRTSVVALFTIWFRAGAEVLGALFVSPGKVTEI